MPPSNPSGSPPSLPLPNDLALQDAAISTQNPAQAALLTQWQAEGFPNDQEVPITIDFVRETLNPATGKPTRSAPQTWRRLDHPRNGAPARDRQLRFRPGRVRSAAAFRLRRDP